MASDGVAVVAGVADERPARADGVTDEAGVAQGDTQAVDPAGVDETISETGRAASEKLVEANLIGTVFGANIRYGVAAGDDPDAAAPSLVGNTPVKA